MKPTDSTPNPQSVCAKCGKTKSRHFTGGFCFRESHFGEHYLMDKFKPVPRKRKTRVLTGLAAKLAIMRAICRAIERDKNE